MTESERLRQLEAKLWSAADQLRANSSLAASQYSIPVLGLILLRYADVRFTQVEREPEMIEGELWLRVETYTSTDRVSTRLGIASPSSQSGLGLRLV